MLKLFKIFSILLILSLIMMISACTTSQTTTTNKSTTLDTTPSVSSTVVTTEMTTSPVESPLDYSKSIKILAIGNSFSQDGTELLWNIMNNYGIENITIGNLYIAGCDLQKHWSMASSNNAGYTYYKNTSGLWTKKTSVSMLTAILEEDWDIITLQQVSGKSGLSNTYDPYLTNLINYVNTKKTNPDAKLAWHMTWAYEGDSTHKDFVSYNNDQLTMYNAIVNTTNTMITSNDNFDVIIPAGTSIQNVRTSFIGDTLTRDGYHLSLDLGRYIAALTWFKTITGFSIDPITYLPSTITSDKLPLIKEAVNASYTKPYEVTPSSFVPQEINLDHYTLLEYETVLGYWNSTDTNYPNQIITFATNSINFVTQTTKFTKETLPNGCVLVIDDEYQYRVNYWKELNSGASLNLRSTMISTNQVIINDAWWSGYNYVTFNVKPKVSVDLTNSVQETGSHFKIYIPKV